MASLYNIGQSGRKRQIFAVFPVSSHAFLIPWEGLGQSVGRTEAIRGKKPKLRGKD